MDAFGKAIWYLNIAATLALLLRLFWTNLGRTYRWLTIYLAADLIQSALFLVSGYHRDLYAQVYMAGQIVKLALSIFVVMELYKLALDKQRALASFGQKTAGYLLGAAAVLSAAGMLIDAQVRPGHFTILHRFFTFERTMDFAVLIFLVAISCFMLWFPVRLNRNVAVYTNGFMVYFLARSLALLLNNLLAQRFVYLMSESVLLVSFGCLLTWILMLRPEGEETMTVIGHRWNPVAMDRLTGQLESINAVLVRLNRG